MAIWHGQACETTCHRPTQATTLHYLFRHPQPEDRPCFPKLEQELSVDDKILLDNSPGDKEDTMASEAVVHLLGGSVVTGQYIYPTLQNKYLYDLDDNISL